MMSKNTWESLTESEKIVLRAAYKIGQVERGVSVIEDSRKQHWRTIDSLESKGLLRSINHWSVIVTEAGEIALKQQKEVQFEEIKREYFGVTEFVEYLRWLAEMHPSKPVTPSQVWELYKMTVREGMVWSDATYGLGLPTRKDWA